MGALEEMPEVDEEQHSYPQREDETYILRTVHWQDRKMEVDSVLE